MSDRQDPPAPPPDKLDPFKLLATRAAGILAGWANESIIEKRAAGGAEAVLLCAALEPPSPPVDAATEARIADYLAGYLRSQLEEMVARGYQKSITRTFSTDYQPDREIREMATELGLKVSWPYKRHLWVHVSAKPGGEFAVAEDYANQYLQHEGERRGWLRSPHVIPGPLRDLVIEAVISGRLAPDVARWEPIVGAP